ncbi:MAG: exonuclease domain-containing protein [Pyrinomonadaceae bacterium MAG19_C2-C3]|nr:exonuclease domain-containing protein [Pyrinomonadaceae bacterium MAG19_C2-C3]
MLINQTTHSAPVERAPHKFSNLVSDSALVDDAVRLLRANGKRMTAIELADRVLQIAIDDAEVASLFIAELVGDDARFQPHADGTIELIDVDVNWTTLDATDFVVVDVETTGARTPECRVTEVGAYRVREGRIVGEFATLINPEQAIPPFIQSLTGITDAMVARAPTFGQVAAEWLAFADRAVLVAHNAPFDVRFLNAEVGRVFPNRRMINPHLCTVSLARRLVPGLINYRLHTVAEHFSISITNRHRAAGDAHATAQIFLHFLARLRDHNITTLGDARIMRC